MELRSRENSMMSTEYCKELQYDEDQNEDRRFEITKALRQNDFTTTVVEAENKQHRWDRAEGLRSLL